MGAISFSIPKELVLAIIKALDIPNFIETGTFKGNTAIWASEHFKQVYTIEIVESFSKEAASRCGYKKNIEFLVGNSKDVLPRLVPKLTSRCFFWLDGHWCMGAGGQDEECPLFQELDAIKSLKDAVIFIDDARCFLGPLPPPHRAEDWPTIEDVFAFFRSNFPQLRVSIIDDVIVAIPKDVTPLIDDYWKATFNYRYQSLNYKLKDVPKLKVLKYLLAPKKD